MRAPELLSPAGSLRNMRFAFAYGADAVYAGQPRYSLRVRNNEFKALEKLAEGIDEAHGQNKRFFLASNLAPHNRKVRSYLDDLAPVIEMRPDALIMSDPGLIMLVRERWPEQVIHLSVQANVVNYASVKFWHQMGVKRIILSRELSLDEVAEIRQECPEIELEVFVHGALCIAYSGRCLLSGYISHRDSNQGACTNTCRWKYQAHEAKENEVGDLVASAVQSPLGQWQPESGAPPKAPEEHEYDGPAFLLQEETRPGELMPAYEDEHGTYIMNSRDLRAVQHVARLAEIGVDSLKIEGRTKSHYYVARTAQVYRQAVDDAVAGRGFSFAHMDELEALSNRGYTEGFYRRHLPEAYQNYEQGASMAASKQFVAEVVEANDQWVTLAAKNHFRCGDRIEWMAPSGNRIEVLEGVQSLKGAALEVIPGSGHVVQVPRPEGLQDSDLPYTLLVRELPKKA